MKIKICDKCKKETDCLYSIDKAYQTKDIIELCDKCFDKANEILKESQELGRELDISRVKNYLKSEVGNEKG